MIEYGHQSINELDIISVTNALKSNRLTTGPFVEEFENQLEILLGVPSISVSSGTAALHCAYAAIGVEPGDEIITPPITFIATQATAALMGAKIVFADVQKGTANIEPAAVEAAITSRTKAIVAVDYAGHPADMDELRNISKRNGIYLIEDSSHSIGSFYKNKPVGSLADITTFSFFPTKNLTTCEGGAVTSANPILLEKARRFARQGLIRNSKDFRELPHGPWHQEVHDFGLNYRLSDLHSALGISQIARISEFKKKRAEVFEMYSNNLRELSTITLPSVRNYVDPMWHLYPIQVEPKNRRSIFIKLREAGIGVQVNYLPVHLHEVFRNKGFRQGQFPISESFYAGQISLPMHAELHSSQIEFVIGHLKSIAS